MQIGIDRVAEGAEDSSVDQYMQIMIEKDTDRLIDLAQSDIQSGLRASDVVNEKLITAIGRQ